MLLLVPFECQAASFLPWDEVYAMLAIGDFQQSNEMASH